VGVTLRTGVEEDRGNGGKEERQRDTKTNMDGPCPSMHIFTPF
jgi:hypothetical protein